MGQAGAALIFSRRHLWHDLTPFICLHDDCQAAEEEFATIHAWSEHMSSMHLALSWTCSRCNDNDRTFRSETAFKSHFFTLHGMSLTLAELETIAEVSRDEAILRHCLICGLTDGMISYISPEQPVDSDQRRRNIDTCMATHLQSIALSCLPWHFGQGVEAEDDEDKSLVAEFDDNEIGGPEERSGNRTGSPIPEGFLKQPRESPTC